MFRGAGTFYAKIMIVVLSGIILIWAGQYLFAQGEGKPFPTKAPELNPAFSADRAIRFSAGEFTRAFNRGDARAIGGLLTDDCDYGDGVGNIYHGREEIIKEYADFFAKNPGAKIQVDITSIRQAGPGAAIEDGTSTVTLIGGPASTVGYRIVHIRQNGQWLISSIRETVDKTPSHYTNLRDLEWVVGNWVARGKDREVHTSIRWMDNKNFLQRTYTVKTKEDVVLSGMQVIGWDPEGRCVTSWTFDSTGGYGHGVWRPEENGWSVASTGVMADGTQVSSTENMTRIDDNHFTWQSVNRMAQGDSLPDTEEIMIERVKGK